MTAEDLTLIATALAIANGHPAPAEYAALVVDAAFPPPSPMPVVEPEKTIFNV